MYDINKERPSIKRHLLMAGLPTKTIGLEFSDLDDSPEKDKVMAWVSLVRSGEVVRAVGKPSCGLGLLLAGKPGHGKTTMASVALQELIRGIASAALEAQEPVPARLGAFMDYPKLLRLQKTQWSEDDENLQEEVDAIYGDLPKDNVQIFILDDLGKEYRTASGWAENQFDALLRSRFNSGLPTIVTTNTPLQKWGTVYGEPMGSFAYEAFVPLVIDSEKGDRRKDEK